MLRRGTAPLHSARLRALEDAASGAHLAAVSGEEMVGEMVFSTCYGNEAFELSCPCPGSWDVNRTGMSWRMKGTNGTCQVSGTYHSTHENNAIIGICWLLANCMIDVKSIAGL